jgi:DnaJ domain
MPLEVAQLKRKLRELKQLELTIRFGRQRATEHPSLMWDVFFSTKEHDPPPVKYPLPRLLQMDRDELKAVIDEYFFRVYFQNYQDQGFTQADVYDPQLLALLGLPPFAGIAEIKQRFRVLAQQYHPDHGGDAEQFIELVSVYERLRGETH